LMRNLPRMVIRRSARDESASLPLLKTSFNTSLSKCWLRGVLSRSAARRCTCWAEFARARSDGGDDDDDDDDDDGTNFEQVGFGQSIAMCRPSTKHTPRTSLVCQNLLCTSPMQRRVLQNPTLLVVDRRVVSDADAVALGLARLAANPRLSRRTGWGWRLLEKGQRERAPSERHCAWRQCTTV
jgi:hypothetical protein